MKSLFKMAQAAGSRVGITKPEELSYRTYSSREGKSKTATFVIGEELRKKMRWLYGDRIDILFDPTLAEGQLVRCKDAGWSLSGAREGKSEGSGRITITLKPGFDLPEPEGRLDLEYETTDNTIYFVFPIKYRKEVKVQ